MINRFSLFLGGLGLFALQGCKTQQGEQAQLPNVIYVFPDQYRNQAMEFWGQDGFRDKVNFRNDPVHTPNLNSFAREALVLSSAQSNCPLSSPHRGMLLTGMYPNKSGIPLNCNSNRPISSLRADVDCIGDVFNKSGYDCAYFGKLHADFPTPNDPQRPGHYVEDRIPAWDAYTPKERRHGFNYWYSYGTFDDRHLAAAGLVLYRNIFGICQQVAGQRCTLYGFRLAAVARCAGAFATTHYCISFYQIQLSATHRVHTFHRKFTAFCRYTYGFPVYPV